MSIIVNNQDRRVRELVAQIQTIYPRLIEDLRSASSAPEASSALETITRSEDRPVLQIRDGDIQLDRDGLWYDRVRASRGVLRRAIGPVGRIEITNHPDLSWVGTGWLVDADIVVTARHVAEMFARRTDDGYVFRSTSTGAVLGVTIDFLQEVGNPKSRRMAITEVLYIEAQPGPDLAFLRVGLAGERLLPLALSDSPPQPDDLVAVIGYYARDSRIPDEELMETLFGRAWDKKQLSPGAVMAVTETSIEHDCSTTGGSGGAPLVDLDTGKVVGLNFAGRYLLANYAVPATVIARRLEGLQSRGGPGALPPAHLELRQSSEYVGADQWNWAVWLEGSLEQLDAVESVEYTLHPTFPKPVRLVHDRSTNFRLEASGWGTFLLHAKIARKDGGVIPASLEVELAYPSDD